MNDLHAQLERLIDVGRYREARQLLERAFAQAPGDPDLHALAARAALGEKDAPRARDHVEQALAADPTHFAARLLLFGLSYDQRQFAEAEQAITQLIRERPHDASLLAFYAELMLTTLHLAKARALTAEALRRDPDDQRARLVNVLLLTVEGRRVDAGLQLAEVIRDDPQGEAVARTLLNVLVEQGRHREAFEIGRQLLRLSPDDPELVEVVLQLRTATHWAALPAYPFRRFGWAGAATVWAGGIVAARLAMAKDPKLGAAVTGVYVLYIVYSWVYAPLLKRWLSWRGF